MKSPLSYLQGYPTETLENVQRSIEGKTLGPYLLRKYPKAHKITNDKALYQYTNEIKNDHLRKAPPLSKVLYDNKINVLRHALGTNSTHFRVQGNKLKAKTEIRVASILKTAPEEFLRMLVVHELAHLREKDHNKAFYKLCQYMEPDYHQLEFDTRLYLTHLDVFGSLYSK